MKKLFVILLVCALSLGLLACGGAESAVTTQPADTTTTAPKADAVTVGFGSGNITPDWSIGLQGYGNASTRVSTGKKTDIFIYCVAITDTEDETVLLISTDSGSGSDKNIRACVSEASGIPMDHIIVSSVHQHSVPSMTAQFVELLQEKAIEAVQQALDDRAPAKMYLNTVETTAMNFVRHYIANDPDGTIVGDNYNDAIGSAYGYKGHESESDKEMRLVKFVREGDKKPIIMVNFQAHPHMGSSATDTNIHGDWPAIMREQVEEKMDAYCVYFSGAGGNLNSTSRIEEENVSEDFKHHGRRAANYITKAEDSYVEAELSDVKVLSKTIAYENDHSMDHLADIAAQLNNIRATDFNAAREEVKKYPEIHSIYHAEAIAEKVAAGPTRELTIGAFAIGDVVFTYHPYEMFDTNGMELRAGTVGNENYTAEEQLENPYKMTFICSLANGDQNGYIPSQLGYTNGGYSTDITYFAPGTGERLVGDYLQILNELHG